MIFSAPASRGPRRRPVAPAKPAGEKRPEPAEGIRAGNGTRLLFGATEGAESFRPPALGITLGVPEPLHVNDALGFIDAVSHQIGRADQPAHAGP